jgi:hypothetical protein
LVNLSVFISGCRLRYARFIAALLCQDSPGDPRQFIRERSRQNIWVEALSGANEPAPEVASRMTQ